MSINHYQYVCDSTSNSLIDQECIDITDAESNNIKCLDYLIVYKQSSQILNLVSCIDSGIKYQLKSNNQIIDFTLAYIDNYYYIVTLENNFVKFHKIDHQCIFTQVSEIQIDSLKNPKLYGLNELGIILIDQTQVYLIYVQNQVIKQDIKQYGKQIIISKNLKYLFILTKESKLIVLNSKTLQLINEHNLKYTDSDPLFFQLFEIHDTISLFSITAQNRIIYWTFQKEDLHTSSLIPTQSIKFKFNKEKQIKLIDFQIDSTQNFLFIPFQSDSTIELFIAQLNHISEQSIIKHIKKFVKESSKSNFFLQFIIPQDYMEKFMHGSNKCESESDYLDFQKCFKMNQEQQIEFTDQEFPYILALTSEKQDKIQFCWFYSDLILTAVLPENQLVLYDSNTSQKKGSSIIQQSQLIHPPYTNDEEIQQKPKEEIIQQTIDPLIKVDQIISNDLLPKIQQAQQQLQVISNDVKNELVDDAEFIFLIKDLIEAQVRKEMDKSGQNDQKALSKLEQQFKQDIQQMESQVENVITQNLELYSQTCENFIMDNFNQQYFEQLINDKIEGFVKQQANQQLQDYSNTIQTQTKEYLNTQIGPMYKDELAKMSKGVVQIFDKIIQYFSETQFIEQTKVNNFNQFIENTSQQLQALNNVITQLIENNKPNADTLNKLDLLISQTESFLINRQQLPNDERLEKIENHILKLRNDFQMLTQNQQIQQMPGMDQFIKGMASQLTQMQIKLTGPQLGMQQIQEVLNQLILQFQFFILKFGS